MQHYPRIVVWLRSLSVVFTALVCADVAASRAVAREEVVIRDLTICRPKDALSNSRERGKWQLISYESGPKKGTMLACGSLIDPAVVTLPLEVDGWYRISLGIWNPIWAYDGSQSVLKAKLTGDPCFRVIVNRGPTGYKGTILQEYDFAARDVTGKDLLIAKRNGQKAYLAFVRLTPLTDEQVEAVTKRRAQPETRVLVSSHDGAGYLNRGGGIVRSREDIWAEIEPYRYADVRRVSWAVNYSHTTNWPSKVGTLFSREFLPATRHEQTLFAALNGLIDQGINPLHEACEHAHRIGIEFDAQFRMAILGRTPPDPQHGFVAEHPEIRMVARDGTPIEKASYAFPATRKFLAAMVDDTASQVDVDGITLNFIRGGDYIAFEAPVLAEFEKRHGEDARKTEPNDKRLLRVRASFMTELVGQVRKTLDEVGRVKGKTIQLHAVVYPKLEINLRHALDVKTWIEQGLIDSVANGQEEAMQRLAKAHGVRFYAGVGPRDVTGYVRAWKRWRGVADGYFVWDMDNEVEKSSDWQVLSRLGHDDEMKRFSEREPAEHFATFRLTKIGGVDVTKIANEEAGYPQKFLYLFSGG